MNRTIAIVFTIRCLFVSFYLDDALSFTANCRKNSLISRDEQRSKFRQSAALYAASDLPTACEWLAEDRDLDLDWLEPASMIDNECEGYESDKPLISLPLYPLEACYIPLGQGHINEIDHAIVRNVEPRNVKMALDLEQKIEEGGDGRFCAVLKANDTGRIATFGTVMRVVHLDKQYMWDGKTIARIIVKCIPEERVEVVNVVNPKAWSRENRLLRCEEYLMANVAKIEEDTSASVDDTVAAAILNDYEAVKKLYQTEPKATAKFPPFAINSISSLPQIDPISDDSSFWSAVHVWQSLCFTVKEAWRVDLLSIINEKTISAAMNSGGPLNLPVHREDLPFDIRFELDNLENNVAKDFIKINMEPCLSFQHLLATESASSR